MTPSKIAVTGGIGSGKSTFCGILKKMGYPVYSCDEIYRELLCDPDYLSALCACFPECTKDGILQKNLLSARVFSDREALVRLNALAHPRIMERLAAQMECNHISFAEVPLLFEEGYETRFNAVIALWRDQAARMNAVKRRDGLSEEEIRSRMKEQFPPDLLAGKQCILIRNDGDTQSLARKAEAAIAQLKTLLPHAFS